MRTTTWVPWKHDEKFTGAIEYFNNEASDILFAVPLAASVGSAGGTQIVNIADVNRYTVDIADSNGILLDNTLLDTTPGAVLPPFEL